MTCKAGPLLIADIPLKNREQNTLRVDQDSNSKLTEFIHGRNSITYYCTQLKLLFKTKI